MEKSRRRSPSKRKETKNDEDYDHGGRALRVLRGVGVKLMGIQRSVSKMPPVTKFAQQLSMALGEPVAVAHDGTARLPVQDERIPSTAQPRLEPQLGTYEPPSRDALASEMAMLTDIMGLTPESDSGSSQ